MQNIWQSTRIFSEARRMSTCTWTCHWCRHIIDESTFSVIKSSPRTQVVRLWPHRLTNQRSLPAAQSRTDHPVWCLLQQQQQWPVIDWRSLVYLRLLASRLTHSPSASTLLGAGRQDAHPVCTLACSQRFHFGIRPTWIVYQKVGRLNKNRKLLLFQIEKRYHQPHLFARSMTVTLNNATSTADRWKYCAFGETSMKFGLQVDCASVVTFSYRAISDSTCDKNGGHFQDGCHRLFVILW